MISQNMTSTTPKSVRVPLWQGKKPVASEANTRAYIISCINENARGCGHRRMGLTWCQNSQSPGLACCLYYAFYINSHNASHICHKVLCIRTCLVALAAGQLKILSTCGAAMRGWRPHAMQKVSE
jgi:hypothetical protein